ncbi:MAG: hypothetical protein ACE5JI_18365 [Acidobacteriota bacterium]
MMKRYHLLAVLVLVIGCQAAEQGGQGRPGETPHPAFDAEGLVEAWVTLWNTYDLSLVDELFLADSRVTYLSSEKEGLIKGIEAVRDHHVQFGFVDGGKEPEQELWVEELNWNDYGTAAVVTGVWFFGSRDDVERAQRGPLTFVYVRAGDEYRLAHVHFASY